MSGIKRWDWDQMSESHEEFADGDFVLHADHESEIARLSVEIKTGETNLADAMTQLAESDSENANLEAEIARLRSHLFHVAESAERYRKAIGIVCEGFTLPNDVRKILEKSLWSDAAIGEDE